MANNRNNRRTQKNSGRSEKRQQRREGLTEVYDVAPIAKQYSTEPLRALNQAQGQAISSILDRDITFLLGPAGTGKTYITAALAAEELSENRIEQIILTRPMQDCGEEMGFLPGEMEDKYEPWMEPLIDVLNERLGKSYVQNLRRNGRIIGKPLQYMRGKSFKDTWVIMDEAQNVSPQQMKMFLTRIGENSKMIIDGDLDQSDLKTYRGEAVESGLKRAWTNLRSVPQIGFVEFTVDDIVRHGIIRSILENF